MNKSKNVLKKRKNKDDIITAVIFLTPVVVLWFWWFCIPFCKSIKYCFFDFNYALPERTHFVGLDNFIRLFQDNYFLKAIIHSTQLVIVTVPIIVSLALLLSVLLNQKIVFRGIFRTIFYLPYVMSSIAVATVFMYLFVKDSPIIIVLSRLFGLDNVTWISDTRYALKAVMLMYIWQQIGFYMVMFLAALQAIPEEVRESARIDGAGSVREFLFITLPLIKPTLYLSLTMGIISSFKVFDQISAISRGTVLGAPAGSTSTIVTYFYVNAFRYGDMGYASASVVVLFAIIFSLTIIQRALVSKGEEALY